MRKLKLYILYWISYVLLFALIQGLPAKDFYTALINECLSVGPKMLFVTIVVEQLMPSYLFRKKTWQFLLFYILLILLLAFLQRLIDNFIIIRYIMTNWHPEPLFSAPVYLYNVTKLQFVVTIPLAFKFFSYLSWEKFKVQTIQAEKLNAELAMLRNQLHPHFLFNVLNSLYLKILNKSDASAEIVLKISDMLRFSIYDVSRPQISLVEEIDFLKNYLDLQQLRFDDRLQLSFSVFGPTQNFVIEPFLILPFVENCFKYGLDEKLSQPWITISLNISDDWLGVKIENSLPDDFEHGTQTTGSYNGLGIVNVKRRLELLYPGQHTLTITNGTGRFLVSMKLKMNHGRQD